MGAFVKIFFLKPLKTILETNPEIKSTMQRTGQILKSFLYKKAFYKMYIILVNFFSNINKTIQYHTIPDSCNFFGSRAIVGRFQ